MLKPLHATLALCFCTSAMAAGPLVLEGPNGHVPATYADPNVALNFDLGNLDSLPVGDNAIADQVVREALAIWNNIATSTINLFQGGDMPVNVDYTNFVSYIPDPDNSAINNDQDGLNPIVYDDEGRIIDAFFGIGQGTGPDATVVGFAASSIIIGSSFFTEGFAVINGNSFLNIRDNQLKLIIAHEIGHFLGLDHSQADIDNRESFFESCPAAADDYPLMYPYACRLNDVTHPDDDVSLSMLYPEAGFFPSQGQLRGTLVTPDGSAVRGANLWVENRQTGEVYSVVSDYLQQCTGFFALMLPPGEYILHANSINREFFAGSSVGPYANSPSDLSFQSPASDIGADLLFTAEGTQAAFISLSAGGSAEVLFRTDGSGSITLSDTQVDLAQIYNSADACPAVSGGGGGSPTLALLAAVLLIPAFRRCSRRSA